MSAATAPVTLFYSNAHEDEALRDELQGHLKLLERRGLLAPWHDRRIVPGADWSGAIDTHLRGAELVLLLVSKDFIESDYIMGTELAVAMQRHAAQAAVVVPIVVRAIDFDPQDDQELPFLRLQGLPTDLRPVTSWPNRDEAWTNVAKGLRATVNGIRQRRPVAASAAAASDAPLARLEPPTADPLLDRIVADVSRQIAQAQRERGALPLGATGAALLQAQTRALIDLPEQHRVLWVDDRPERNRFEAAALAKLQIEVVTARSTDEALQRIAADTEGYALVISDWERSGEPAEAGLRLLARLGPAGVHCPLIFYHGVEGAQRAARALQARAAGALGEAVRPDELMTLVLRALQTGELRPLPDAGSHPHPNPLPKGARE